MYFVYITTNQNHTVLYTGVTNNLIRRMWEHREHLVQGFTNTYKATQLVYYEQYTTAYEAIEREKQIKSGTRERKEELIKSFNPKWIDLFKTLM